jgi:hypothetical protein
MSKKVKRTVKNQATLGSGDISSISFNQRSGGTKNLPVGPELRMPAGASQLAGFTANGSAVQVNTGTIVMLFNNSASVAWVTMGKDSIASAPAGISTAIPLKPNDWTVLNMGENNRLQTSAATVGCYIIEDESSLQVLPDTDSSF